MSGLQAPKVTLQQIVSENSIISSVGARLQPTRQGNFQEQKLHTVVWVSIFYASRDIVEIFLGIFMDVSVKFQVFCFIFKLFISQLMN